MNATVEINKPTYRELIEINNNLINSNKELSKNNNELQLEVAYFKEELGKLKRLIFGSKRERHVLNQNPNQLTLDLGLPELTEVEEETEKITYTRKKVKKKIGHGRNELPGHLTRHDIIIEPEEDTEGLLKIGEEITEELEYEPGKLFVNRYIRPKYADKENETVIIGSMPFRPIEKGIAGPGLLAQISISKFVDHLPLYRQLQQFKRQGVEIASSTIGDWVKGTYELLLPLYEKHKEEILKAKYLMIDETLIKVKDNQKKGSHHQGYYWVYYDPVNKRVFFDYREGRNREGPNQVLKNFKGYIQTDGYAGYNEVSARKDIVSIACMAHARRKFVDAKPHDKKRANEILELIRQLYMIERFARTARMDFNERHSLRQEHAKPLLSKIKTWLTEQIQQVLPSSSMGKAIQYMLGQWLRLEKYITNGMVEIDNNLVENAIRPVALGRKNYLFAGSHDGARRAALIYSLVATAKIQGVEPFKYLKEVIQKISDYPQKQIANLLPQNYK